MNGSLPLKSLKPNSKFLSSRIKINSFYTQIPQNPLKSPLTSLQCGALLQSFTNSKSSQMGKQLHAYMLSSGILLENTYLYTKLSAMYAICGIMTDARFIFDQIVLKNSFLWNVMIRGYACCNGFSMNSLVLYREMVIFGKRADNYTYPFVLKACGDLSLVEIGRKIHCEIVVCGFESDIYVGNSLIAMYAKFSDLGSAQKLFDKMRVRDLTSWNTMVSGYAKNGEPGEALSVFYQMVKNGVRVDSSSLLGVLSACADAAALKQAKEIHGYVVRNGMDFDSFVRNALINVYCSCNFIKCARGLFEEGDSRDIVSWNSMISGYARCGDAIESLWLFRQMNLENMVPDKVTLISVLGASDQIAALQFGRGIHACLAKNGFVVDTIVGTSLIDMYAKCGSLGCSRRVFDEMLERNLVSWSAMIAGYGFHGRGKEAISIFSEMTESGVRPDAVIFTSVLSACSHAGLMDEGWAIFNQMRSEYSISPRIEHYACLVDLLGRAGRLDDAYELIKKMQVKPNVDIWAALLSACQVHRNVRLAEIAAQNAFLLKPKGVGLYVSLSNTYAAEKRWDDVETVRARVRQRGLKKPPGCSFVELGMEIHRFLVGDKMHPQSELIYVKLEDLNQRLKEDGYAPDTSSVFYDVEDDLKEKMLWDHSERLAIAFSLINTAPGMTIRITKNLRVCVDCHVVTKLISKIVNREIVMRDAHRFHHFRDGSCSCGDYW
ncbi:pentatricopeptide repeat-containing protein At3g12770-like [Magnolia sinica]|uniref:pentatricopeptide repeat-containing protein At3g12770-like n=1 Tax=Magnolia sinica TaxID=86752 RepID=UPI00265A5CCA|nr:pentatricopeptide repeat-containing protein At3g12770-like [Magnolia sinica]